MQIKDLILEEWAKTLSKGDGSELYFDDFAVIYIEENQFDEITLQKRFNMSIRKPFGEVQVAFFLEDFGFVDRRSNFRLCYTIKEAICDWRRQEDDQN